MVTPTIKEISGVNHPAHLAEGWLVMKSVDATTAALLAHAEAVSKGHAPSSTTGSHDMKPLSKEARAALPADTVAYIESLEKQATESVSKSASDLEREAFEKMLAEIPDGARQIMRKQQQETAEAKALAKGLYDAQEDAKFEAFAKSLAHVPGVTIDSASTFRKLAETDPNAWEQVSKSLVASEAALAQSNLFKELGSGHSGAPGSAGESIEAMAKAIQDDDKNLSYPEALAKAAEQAARENPDLIVQHRREQLRANASAGE